jgi:small subunit ribosomal protein S4
MLLSTWFCQFPSRARLLVRHAVISGQRKTVNIPSILFALETNLRERAEPADDRVLTAMEGVQRRGVPEWAEVDRDAYSGQIKLMPSRSDITMPINEKLIVELYSK